MSLRHTALFAGLSGPAPLPTHSIEASGASDTLNLHAVAASGPHAVLSLHKGEGSGRAGMASLFQLSASGVSRLVFDIRAVEASGRAGTTENFKAEGSGRYSIVFSNFTALASGVHQLAEFHRISASGSHDLFNLVNLATSGRHTITGITHLIIGSGAHSHAFDAFKGEIRGRHAYLDPIKAECFGRGRIQNDALNVYELYRGVGSEPDFTGAPFETFATLPHTTAALPPGQTYYFTLRRRNAWNLVSQNIASYQLTVAANGAADSVKPSAPQNVRVSPSTAGTVRVEAEYMYLPDNLNAADQFLIYSTSNGIDPDPLTDTPSLVSMAKVDGVAKLNYLSGTFANGLTIKVLVRTRRTDPGPVNVDSLSSAIVSTVSNTTGPAAPVGAAFFGKVAAQR